MTVFHSDLDNTLIYSYKHEIGIKKKCVEIYQGREISFMTSQSYQLLKKVVKKVLFVPTTTRSIEQYERIDLGIGVPKYALVCNGGILLEHGVKDFNWYQESKLLVSDCKGELQKAQKILAKDENRNFEIRNIEQLFLFTKSLQPEKTTAQLQSNLNLLLVDVLSHGAKVYVIPKKLNKGTAMKRFKKKVTADIVIAAGDSEFDVPMFQEADFALAPKGLQSEHIRNKNLQYIETDRRFSDDMLTYINTMY